MENVKDYPPYLDYPKPRKIQTNADRIRAMSDEELADFIQNCGCPDHARDCMRLCYDCVFEWLKEPVEDE